MFELIRQMGGTILPSETLVQHLSHHRADLARRFLGDLSSPVPQNVPWTTLLPLDATLNCLFSKPSVFQAVFPQQEGTMFLSMPGNNNNKNKPEGEVGVHSNNCDLSYRVPDEFPL